MEIQGLSRTFVEDVVPVKYDVIVTVILLFSAKSKCFGRHRKSYPLIPGWDLRGDYQTHFWLKLA